jgi:hypothetical protein
MKINKALNLVVAVQTEEQGMLYVHSTPISREVFEANFMLISKTFAALYSEGLNVVAGPRVAMLMLRKVAEDLGIWEIEGTPGPAQSLVDEIRRLSNVIMPGPEGWVTMPLASAVARDLLHPDDVSEIEGMIAFFTCASAMHRKSQVQPILDQACQLWSSLLSLLNATEFANSLPISIEGESSGETVSTSSVPS